MTNPRTISTEGLLIEHYFSVLRSLELASRRIKDGQEIPRMIRRDEIRDELEMRTLRATRPQLKDVKRRAV